MKKIIFTIVVLFIWGAVHAQCPTGDIFFDSQQEIDDFATDYPGCTEVPERISIYGSDITSLTGLSQITSVGGSLRITFSSLTSLSGLENLTSIEGSLEIINDDNLTSLTYLENLTSIGGGLEIANNDNMISFTGLDNLTSIGGNLWIERNVALTNFSDLENLTSIGGDLKIGENNDLINLSGLDNLTSIEGNLNIRENNDLINLSGLNNIITVGADLNISLNYSLTSLSGLDNLTSTGGDVNIVYSHALTNLSGLENLTSVGVDLEIRDNNNLTNLSGLNNLTSVGVDLRIRRNNDLINLSGLENLTSVGIDLEIKNNNDLINLSGLENLTSVNEDLIIFGNRRLTSLTGLDNLISVGEVLSIGDNNLLTDLTGLGNLTSVTNRLSISSNDSLVSLDGLENLTQVDELRIGHYSTNYDYDGTFYEYFFPNPVLTDISALQNLTSVSSVSIQANYSLTDLSGLENIGSISYLNIRQNHNLSDCSLDNFCEHIALGGNSLIEYNNIGCNSTSEVIIECGSQCPTQDIILSTQEQVDNFNWDNLNCSSLNINLTVQGADIQNLDGLFFIDSISGNLLIQLNDSLDDITELNSLKWIDGNLTISNNPGLISLSGLDNLNSIDGYLEIIDNDALTTLSGIDNIDHTTIDFLRLTGNGALSFCGLPNICAYLDDDLSNVSNNATGCDNVTQVLVTCGFLPVELLRFDAQIQHKTALLTWQTATEANNKGFEVQRSKDGDTWETIAWQAGQGNSQTLHEYTYTDRNPRFGTSYYRLKQIDFGGTYSYSSTVSVDYKGKGISIYPNPVKDVLQIADINDSTILSTAVFDVMGKQILLQNTDSSTLDTSTLRPGVYIVEITFHNGIFSDIFLIAR